MTELQIKKLICETYLKAISDLRSVIDELLHTTTETYKQELKNFENKKR